MRLLGLRLQIHLFDTAHSVIGVLKNCLPAGVVDEAENWNSLEAVFFISDDVKDNDRIIVQRLAPPEPVMDRRHGIDVVKLMIVIAHARHVMGFAGIG
mgnify:CR=1 FL=1